MTFQPIPADQIDLTWPKELPHFSASSAKMAVRCPEQWRRRYVLREKKPPSMNMLAGRADHAAVASSMEQKVESHQDMPVNLVRELYVGYLEEAVEQSGGIGEVVVTENKEERKAKVTDLDEERRIGPALVEAYMRQVAGFVQPTAVEEKFEMTVPGVPVPVIGYIDLATETVMIDRKRKGARGRKGIEPEWSIQAEVYQLARPLPFEWHLTFATKVPKVEWGEGLTQPLPPRDRSLTLLAQIVRTIGFYFQAFGPDEPWPTNGKLHPWACGYCGWRDECIGWRGVAWQP